MLVQPEPLVPHEIDPVSHVLVWPMSLAWDPLSPFTPPLEFGSHVESNSLSVEENSVSLCDKEDSMTKDSPTLVPVGAPEDHAEVASLEGYASDSLAVAPESQLELENSLLADDSHSVVHSAVESAGSPEVPQTPLLAGISEEDSHHSLGADDSDGSESSELSELADACDDPDSLAPLTWLWPVCCWFSGSVREGVCRVS